MGDGAVIDRLFDALDRGDIAAARACFAPHGRLWHNFDGLTLDLDAAVRGWDAMVAHFPERRFEDVVRQPLEHGFLQQHRMVLRTASGERRAWPVCMVVQVEDGLITHFKEYIDRAGSVVVPDATMPAAAGAGT